ncbi:hypothetical protein [Frisingicoccus sp.]|nr:hypothetical protein [Frisingicoccus sp.]
MSQMKKAEPATPITMRPAGSFFRKDTLSLDSPSLHFTNGCDIMW